MENELNLDLDKIEENADNQLQVKNRFQQLANDKRELAQKLEAETKAKVESEEKLQALEKETNFYKTFSQTSAKYPEAINYQAQILERVNKGYDLEEATRIVLDREGKLTQAPPAPPKPPIAEGGSAVTNVNVGEKSISDLSMSEKLAELKELEKSGELQQALRQGINRT